MTAARDSAGGVGMGSLAGKVAVVTGAASGLGLAMARNFGREGARVVLADLARSPLEASVAQLADEGVDALAVVTDVGVADSVEALADRAFAAHSRVDVVVNNAGTVVTGPIWDIPLAEWRRLLDVNLWGVIHGIHTFVPRLIAQGGPAYVVNTASMAGVMTLSSLAPYVASKQAVVGLTEVLHHDLAALGAPVGVSVVCPGYVPTRLGMADREAQVAEPPPGGVSADDVAATVRRAMREGRFYVFTHPGSTDHVARRQAAIVDGRAPVGVPLPSPGR